MKDLVAGYVYVLERREGYVKIGKATDAERRIRGIECQSGMKALRTWISPACGNYSEIERKCHNAIRNNRDIGEYFNVTFDVAVNMLEQFEFAMIGKKKVSPTSTITVRIPNFISNLCRDAAHDDGITLSEWGRQAIMNPLNYGEGEIFPFRNNAASGQ